MISRIWMLGVLLLFRHTTTLGALVAAGVMSNVVMLNFGYDIPVKLFSTHLLLFAGALLVPDGRRLLNVLLLNPPAGVADLTPPFTARRANLIRLGVKALVVGGILYQTVSSGAGESLGIDVGPELRHWVGVAVQGFSPALLETRLGALERHAFPEGAEHLQDRRQVLGRDLVEFFTDLMAIG